MPARSRRRLARAAATGSSSLVSSQDSGSITASPPRTRPHSFTRCTLTRSGSSRPCPGAGSTRATPRSTVPSLANPVSSTTSASSRLLAANHRANMRRTATAGRGRNELLQPLMIDAQPRRHRLHRLAPAIRQQAAHVQLLRPLLPHRSPAGVPGRELHQPGPEPSAICCSPAREHEEPRNRGRQGSLQSTTSPVSGILCPRLSSGAQASRRRWVARRRTNAPPALMIM